MATPIIRVLEHVSYVINALLIDANRDAAYEIERLISLLKEDPSYYLESSGDLIIRLKEVEKNCSTMDYRRAKSLISPISGDLWKKVLLEDNL